MEQKKYFLFSQDDMDVILNEMILVIDDIKELMHQRLLAHKDIKVDEDLNEETDF